jgi:hypothetical protein
MQSNIDSGGKVVEIAAFNEYNNYMALLDSWLGCIQPRLDSGVSWIKFYPWIMGLARFRACLD